MGHNLSFPIHIGRRCLIWYTFGVFNSDINFCNVICFHWQRPVLIYRSVCVLITHQKAVLLGHVAQSCITHSLCVCLWSIVSNWNTCSLHWINVPFALPLHHKYTKSPQGRLEISIRSCRDLIGCDGSWFFFVRPSVVVSLHRLYRHIDGYPYENILMHL
jgi:hypothetical protein